MTRLQFALLGLLSGGCVVEADQDDHFIIVDDAPPAPIVLAPIDPDARIDVAPGDGAGVFIEYETGGGWHVFTTCDTLVSDIECLWDIIVSVDPRLTITLREEEELEADDVIVRDDPGSLRFVAYTDVDFDGFFFDTDAGETVELDAFIDGESDPRFINWIGLGGLNQGAPSNPILLEPTDP